MSVVLRCPSCGTRQVRAGECEACSEGEVRYFCTNHDEGIWLEGAVCSRCDAKFGDAPRKPPASPAPSVPTRPADFRKPVRRRPPERPLDLDVGERPPLGSEREKPAEPEVLPRTPSLRDLLEEISARRARARRGYDVEVPGTEPRAPRVGLPFAGCLVRAVGLVVLLVVVVIIFLVLLFAGFIIR